MGRQRLSSTLIVVTLLLVAVPSLASPSGSSGGNSARLSLGGSWGLLRFARNDMEAEGGLPCAMLWAGFRCARNDVGGAWSPVVPASVWASVADGGQADVLVVVRGRADLTAASTAVGKQARGERVHAALWETAAEAQRALRAELDCRGVEYRPFYIVNAIQLKADEGLLRALAARPDVERIVPNTPVPGIPPGEVPASVTAPDGIEPNLAYIGADDVWAMGHTGQGAVVAGQDTGYEWDHPALIDQYRGRDGGGATHDYNWHDAIHENIDGALGNPCGFDSPVPCDDHGHGTHTMGTMVGDDGGSNQIGVAPGARWIGCRNMEEGIGRPSTYLECFEFFLAPYPVGGDPGDGLVALAPDVVNNSWGCPSWEGCDQAATDQINNAVSVLRQAGIVVVASAGNSGYNGCASVVNPPAVARDAITVGSFDYRTGQIAPSSSRGPVTDALGTYIKPDLAAPGVGIWSSYLDDDYTWMSGTSMAAPHVAGTVALLLSAAPAYRGDVDGIEALLTSNAVARTTSQGCGDDTPVSVPNNVWGWGELDALAAVEAARPPVVSRVYLPLVISH